MTQNLTITVQFRKFQTFRIQNGSLSLFRKSLYRYITVKYSPSLMKFVCFSGLKLISRKPKIAILDMTDAHMTQYRKIYFTRNSTTVCRICV